MLTNRSFARFTNLIYNRILLYIDVTILLRYQMKCQMINSVGTFGISKLVIFFYLSFFIGCDLAINLNSIRTAFVESILIDHPKNKLHFCPSGSTYL
jgi:hypothetical protein